MSKMLENFIKALREEYNRQTKTGNFRDSTNLAMALENILEALSYINFLSYQIDKKFGGEDDDITN